MQENVNWNCSIQASAHILCYCTSAHILSYIILTYLIEMASKASYFLNTLRPGQNGRHFADNIFKCIFLNENVWIPIKISLKFFPKGPINNIPALVQIMAWRRPGDKPLSEAMMVRLQTHVCVTQPQWVKIWSGRLQFKNTCSASESMCWKKVSAPIT